MTRTVKRAVSTSIAAASLTLTVGFVAPANATDDFGQHVSTCAQTMGFDGQMNPGMHQGHHGADHTMTC